MIRTIWRQAVFEEFEKDPDGAARNYGDYSVLTVRPFIARREKIAAMFERGAAAGLKSPYSATTATLQNPAEEFLLEIQAAGHGCAV